MTHQEREKRKEKKSLKWAIFWFAVGVVYWLNPVDIPTPIDDVVVAALAAYKTYKNLN